MVLICTAFFLATGVLTAFRVFSREGLVTVLGLSYPGIIDRFWLFQFITAPLLHANLTHLLFNMLSLWMLGPDVEGVLGKRRYIVFSLVCAISAMGGFLLLDHGQGHIVLGYSGVIFGILVAQAVYFPDKRLLLYFFPVKMRHAALILGAVELYLTIAPEEGGSIAHAAHLFGGLAAYVLLRIWRKESRRSLRPTPPPAGSIPLPLRHKIRRTRIPDKL
jgi:membrane associated rhomboid family serine protease